MTKCLISFLLLDMCYFPISAMLNKAILGQCYGLASEATNRIASMPNGYQFEVPANTPRKAAEDGSRASEIQR